MNIVNLLSLLWVMLTWSMLKMIHLPEKQLEELRVKKQQDDKDSLHHKSQKLKGIEFDHNQSTYEGKLVSRKGKSIKNQSVINFEKSVRSRKQ